MHPNEKENMTERENYYGNQYNIFKIIDSKFLLLKYNLEPWRPII